MFVFTGAVVPCIGVKSELLDRRENASDVVGKDRRVRSATTETYINVFILPPVMDCVCKIAVPIAAFPVCCWMDCSILRCVPSIPQKWYVVARNIIDSSVGPRPPSLRRTRDGRMRTIQFPFMRGIECAAGQSLRSQSKKFTWRSAGSNTTSRPSC